MRIAALFNVLLRAFEASGLGKHNRGKGEGEAQKQLRDKERAKLAVVGGSLDNARRLISDFAADHIDIIHVFGAELTQGQGEIRK